MALLLLVVSSLCALPAAEQVTISGSIEASIARRLPNEASALSAQVARLLRWRGDVVKNIHAGDEMRFLWESAPEPELVALDYRGAEIELTAFRFAGSDKVLRYYDENGKLIEPIVNNPPLTLVTQITETVQHGRGKRRHEGIDFKAPEGTPVRLPFPAEVVRVNWSRRVNGNCVEVVLRDGRVARFLHLAHIEKLTRPGARLGAGTVVATVGNTGRSSAPHLHYEIREPDGRAVDPLKLHGTASARLSEAELQDFLRLRTELESELAAPTASAPRRPRHHG